MAKQNQIDQLTKLPGNQAFIEKVNALIAENSSTENEFAIIILDIDKFEAVNDTYGMKVGDEVLKTTADELKKYVAGQGHIFRCKADEFTIVMVNTEREQAFLLFQEFLKSIAQEREYKIDNKAIKMNYTVSMGIAAFPPDSTTGHELVRKAKDALYRAKTKGRNRIYLAREEKMVTKTAHYTQGQLDRLTQLAKEKKINEAILLREALDDLIRKYDE